MYHSQQLTFVAQKKEFITVSSARNAESCLANLIGREIITSLLQNKHNVNEPVAFCPFSRMGEMEKYKQQPHTHTTAKYHIIAFYGRFRKLLGK